MERKDANEVRRIYRTMDIVETQNKIDMLGLKTDPMMFLNLRLGITILTFLVCLFIAPIGFLTAPVISFIVYYSIGYFYFNRRIKARQVILERLSLDFFEILTLSLESGNNLENALSTTVDSVDNELSVLFKQVLLETKFGKSLNEAMFDLTLRMPSEAINNIILNMMQTDMFGNNIVSTLGSQLEFIRDKRILEVKGEISKIPNKISVLSVLFVIPLMLLVILGPIIVSFITS